MPPEELRQRRRWVRRAADKTPLAADGRGSASSTNPLTWTTYERATESPVGVGLGYVLHSNDGIVCVDLDDCVDGHTVAPWAQQILDRCPPTYVEVSPSGRGLHIWGRGHVGNGRVIRGAIKAELYDRDRYIALGRRRPGAPTELADLGDLISWLTS